MEYINTNFSAARRAKVRMTTDSPYPLESRFWAFLGPWF